MNDIGIQSEIEEEKVPVYSIGTQSQANLATECTQTIS